MASAFWLLLAGAGIADGKTSNLQSKSYVIKKNGTYVFTPDEGYDGFTSINVDTQVALTTEKKSVVPSKQAQKVLPSAGVDALSEVDVEPIPDNYVDTSTATAGAPQILAPYTAFVQGKEVTGTMPTYDGSITDGGTIPTLYAPTIAISDKGVLTVTDNKNGSFADKYYLVINGIQGAAITNKTVDLTTVFADYAVGVYNVQARVTATNNMLQAADSSVLTYGVYAITYTLTHITATTAPTRILQGMTAEITLVADTDWYLPAQFTVNNASVVEYDLDTGKLVIGSPTGQVGVIIEGTQEAPIVAKGDIITIESKQYRVLNAVGNVAEVLCAYNTESLAFNSTSKTITFPNGRTGQQYQGSDLDTYLNETFYATLSATMQTAIVPKLIEQNMFSTLDVKPNTGSYYKVQNSGGSITYKVFESKVSVGTRNIYLLDFADVLAYNNVDPITGILTSTQISQMFQSTSSKEFFFRSSYYSQDTYLWGCSSSGNIISLYFAFREPARPAFQIDLSKVEWSKA